MSALAASMCKAGVVTAVKRERKCVRTFAHDSELHLVALLQPQVTRELTLHDLRVPRGLRGADNISSSCMHSFRALRERLTSFFFGSSRLPLSQ